MAVYQTDRYRCLAVLVSSYRKSISIQTVIFDERTFAFSDLFTPDPPALHRPGWYQY